MNLFNKKVYFRSLSTILIITTFLPVFYNNLPPIIGSYHLWALIWVGSIIVFDSKILRDKFIIQVLLYGLVFLVFLLNSIWLYMRDWDKEMIINEFYYIAIAVSIFTYYKKEKDYSGFAKLIKWAMLFFGITVIMSIVSAYINPMYARSLTGGDFLRSTELKYFQRLGGGDYSFASAIVCLFPMMIYFYKYDKQATFPKKYILAFGILCFYALLKMQIFANILMAAGSIILSLLGSSRIKRSLIIFGILTIISISLPVTFYANVLVRTSKYFEQDSETFFKLNDMATFMIYGNDEKTGAGQRAARYPLLIQAFLNNPLLGHYAGNDKTDIAPGGHLYWMNKLTIFGLFGFLPYVFIHYRFIQSNLKLFNRNFAFYYLLSVGSIIALGLMKNLSGRSLWFTYFIILPGLFYLQLTKYQNNSETDIDL